MKVLVTGAAGFIGYHVCQRLLETGSAEVLGVDNLNDYYSVDLKKARLAMLEKSERFRFVKLDFASTETFAAVYAQFTPDYVVHLGAQAGVRYSVENPGAYIHSNLNGFTSVLEAARAKPPKHLVFASSSSVYGAGATVPFQEDAPLGHPLSFYAATKQSNESIAFTYARNHGMAITGLRFFTAYGPWGRPDMTPVLFARAIASGTPIRLYNQGKYRRDFTYIDDIARGVVKALLYPPIEAPNPPYRIFNLGHNQPVEMIRFVSVLEQAMGKQAIIEMLPPQPTEMEVTCADITRAQKAFGYCPKVELETGVQNLVDWYKSYYAV